MLLALGQTVAIELTGVCAAANPFEVGGCLSGKEQDRLAQLGQSQIQVSLRVVCGGGGKEVVRLLQWRKLGHLNASPVRVGADGRRKRRPGRGDGARYEEKAGPY